MILGYYAELEDGTDCFFYDIASAEEWIKESGCPGKIYEMIMGALLKEIG